MPKRNSKAMLAKLAERAGQQYQDSVDAWCGAAEFVLEARKIAGHGEWLPFLEAAGIGERTAQRMLLIAEAGLKSDIVTDLGGIAKACEFIAAVKRARQNWTPARDASTGEIAEFVAALEPSARSIFFTALWQVDLATWSEAGAEEAPAPVADFAAGFKGSAAWTKERESLA